jgi:prepilin-type N-terminal cleavage/methylation domain-containing protein
VVDLAAVTRLMDPNKQAGFTLVEVLVTLVLLSMVGAIVFGSLGQVLDARARLRPYLDQAGETALVAAWFRQTVQGLLADYDTGQDKFSATESGFAGLTASPLMGPPGTPTGFAWVLKYDAGRDISILEYTEKQSKSIPIARWPGKLGSLSYFGQDHEWRRQWPPPDLNQSERPQLPQLIRLGGVPREVLPMIIAAPRAAPASRPLPPSLLGAVLQ